MRRYCSIGNRVPPLVNISDTSSDSPTFQHPDEGMEVESHAHNDDALSELPEDTTLLTNGILDTVPDSPPLQFRAMVGEIEEDSLAALYGRLSDKAASRAQIPESTTPAMTAPSSPVVPARHISHSLMISMAPSSGSTPSRPPGFSSSQPATSTPVHVGEQAYSPISSLHFPSSPPVNNGISTDLQQLAVVRHEDETMSEDDPEEDPEEQAGVVAALANEEMGQFVVADPALAEEHIDIAIPAIFGLHLFNDLDDSELLEMIRDTGFDIPTDEEVRVDLISRLRLLDQQ